MNNILAELFDSFDPEEQACIRAAEAGASGIIAEGEREIRDRLRVSGSMENRDWILEPQDLARLGAANSEFVAYCNVFWSRTDLSSQESVRAFLVHLDATCRGVFAKYGQWECSEGVTALRAEAERLAWMAHARELAIARSVTSHTRTGVSTDTTRGGADGAGTGQTAEFWRGIHSNFLALSVRQDNVLVSPTHEKWLKAYSFCLERGGDFSRCRIEGGFDGAFFSEVGDVVTRAGCALGCPAEIDPIAFWILCLARDLIRAKKPEIRSEFLGQRESSGIIQGFLASSIGYCSRLAARAERETHNSRLRSERQQPERTTDPGTLSFGREFPRYMYHATEQPRMVTSREEEAQLGGEWSRVYIHQEYPKAKYHWSGNSVTVWNAQEEAALGNGWANSSGAFAPYRGERRVRTEDQDPTKWLYDWPVPRLTSDHRKKIKAVLLRADVTFDRSPDSETGAMAAMRQAFDGIAQVLFDGGILTKDLLRKDLLNFVWDSAIAGGWWRRASESRQDIFPERIGRYWVWREDNAEAQGLFRAEIRHWEAELLDAPSPTPPIPVSRDRQSQDQPAESDVSGKEKQSEVDSSLPGTVDTPVNTTSWKDVRTKFENWTADYDELAADFDSLRPGKWALIRAASSRIERIYKDIATTAAAKAGLSAPDDKTEPWQLWLEFMWSQGWRRPEKLSAQSGSVRQVRPWQVAKPWAEEGARTLPRVFQTSADCCRDLEEREEASAAIGQSPVAPGQPASSADGAESRVAESQSVSLGMQDKNAENVQEASPADTRQKRKGDLSLIEGKRLVSFRTAEEYLGISERQRQNLMSDGALQVEGQGINRKITTESLLKYLPRENPK